MIISPKHKLMFFKSMKTAGSSVEKALYAVLDENAFCAGGYDALTGQFEYTQINNEHSSFDCDGNLITELRFHQHTSPEYFYSKIKNPEIYRNYRKITIVRNPWDMVLSYYRWARTINKAQWVETGNRNIVIESTDSKKKVRRKFLNYLSWLSRFSSQKSALDHPEGEISPTLDWLSCEMEGFVDDNHITDYMRYEKLDEHFKKLCLFLGEELDLTYEKSSSDKIKNVHYSYFYNKEAENLIRKAFPKTIEKFGYTFDRRVK